MNLSFLDVLSCGLGASILLFLIFSAMEHQGDRDSQADTGLPIEAMNPRVGEASPDVDRVPALFLVTAWRGAGDGSDWPELRREDDTWRLSRDRSAGPLSETARSYVAFVRDRTDEFDWPLPDAGLERIEIRQVGGGRVADPQRFEIRGGQVLKFSAGIWSPF